MKSTLESQCQDCDRPINIGDEIARVGNGLWSHQVCSVFKNENIKKINEKFELLDEGLKKFDLDIQNIQTEIKNKKADLKKAHFKKPLRGRKNLKYQNDLAKLENKKTNFLQF